MRQASKHRLSGVAGSPQSPPSLHIHHPGVRGLTWTLTSSSYPSPSPCPSILLRVPLPKWFLWVGHQQDSWPSSIVFPFSTPRTVLRALMIPHREGLSTFQRGDEHQSQLIWRLGREGGCWMPPPLHTLSSLFFL